jgi:hypothetical protein
MNKSIHRSIKTLEQAVARFFEEMQEISHRQGARHFADRLPRDEVERVVEKLRVTYETVQGHAPEVPRKGYVRTDTNDTMGREIHEQHESYGLIGLSRVSGHRRLFGSSVEHGHFISLSIRRGKRMAGEHGERFRADTRVPIVEVDMTAAQFAELITSFNVGDGIPCTISHVEGVHMDPVPDGAGSELSVMHDHFRSEIAETVTTLKAAEVSLAAVLAKKSITKADRDEIAIIVRRAVRLLDDSAPFVVERFGENVEKMAAKGKSEVEAYLTMLVLQAGLATISGAKAAEPKELAEKEKP